MSDRLSDARVCGVAASPSLDALEEGSETSAEVLARQVATRGGGTCRCRQMAEEQPTALQRRAHGERVDALWRVATALASADPDRWWRRVDRLYGCCRWPNVLATPSGQTGMSLGRCRDRLCPTCSLIRSRQTADRVHAAVARMDSPRFMTLTIRSAGEPLASLLQRLREGFRRLRQTREWQRRVRGGVYAIETTYREASGGWHPHVHLIWDGGYFAQRELSRLWLRCTGDSPIVDVRAIRSKRAVAKYVAKYVAKGVAAMEWPDDKIAEYGDAMHGARLLHTFGNLHGVKLDVDESEPLPVVGRESVPLAVMLRAARGGDRRVARLLRRLASLGGLWSRLITDHQDPGHRPRRPATPERRRRIGLMLHAWAWLDRHTSPIVDPPPRAGFVDRQLSLDFADHDMRELRPRHGPFLAG